MKTQKEIFKDLKSEFSRYGIGLNSQKVKEVEKIGVDKFLKDRGVPIISKDLTQSYIILNEYKNVKQIKI